MGTRIELGNELKQAPTVKEVYFQPPQSIQMKYPCIRYSKSAIDVKHADDKIYRKTNQYTITIIDPNPDSTIPDWILDHFAMCRFDRAYIADNLNHFTIILYY